MIGVVDYRAGNAPSVGYALESLGLPYRFVTTPADLDGCERLILPGVGAARATLDSLRESALIDALTAAVHDDRRPFLGICIGLQVLFGHSEEGDVDCLGWIPGRVRRFPDDVRVPQIGWNVVRPTRPHPLTDGLPDPAHCYFVNSYFAEPDDADDVLARTDYAGSFCSIAGRGNVVATQFHAEKSGQIGLALLERFAKWDGTA
jgi:imidazole glycerol-phosphate synthase subunit HisH